MPDKHPSALRAILFADAVQYSRHMQADESATMEFMQRSFAVFRSLAAERGGEVLKTMGDGVMVEFGSATEAVLYALALQDTLAQAAEGLPSERRIRFRIGIHLGEVQHRDGDVYGHIVNVASRLEHLADPGGICISQAVFEQVRQNVPATFGSLGQRMLKNLPAPVTAYRVHRPGEGSGKAAARTAASTISISLIERLSLADAAGHELTPKSIKARALVGYLVLSHHHKEMKERVLGLLWSSDDLAHAQQEYRSAVRQIQQAFQRAGSDAFHASAGDVEMALAALQVDLLAVSERLEEGIVPTELVEGHVSPDQIMAGVERADQVFDAWLKVTRHRWRDRLVEQLESCLERFSGDRLSSKHAAIALLGIDPTHEPAACVLMQLHAAEGKSAAALRVYQSLHDVLAREYGIEPAEATRNVMLAVRSGRSPLPDGGGHPSHSASPTGGRLPVIEVRRFVNGEGSGAVEHRLAGFRAEVISCLIKFRDWVIVDEPGERQPQAGHVAGAIDYRLEARRLGASDDDMITMTLADAHSDRIVWSERYPMALSHWGNVSTVVARKTAAVLDIYLSAERVAGHAARRDLSLAAYDDWLRGENLLTLWQPEAEFEAERLFRSVIAQMPRFAPAYSSLASVFNVRHLVIAGFRRDAALEAEALKLAQQAVQLDPLETRAHLTLAWSYAMAGRFEQADIHYDLAFDLNPNNPKTLFSCAHGLAYSGHVERAAELAQLALGLAPIVAPYQWAYLAGIRFICADYSGSVEAATMGTGSLIDTLAWKAAALSLMGEADAARDAARQFLASARAQWSGSAPSNAEIADWMLHGFPIKDDATRNRLADGLGLAGLPVNETGAAGSTKS